MPLSCVAIEWSVSATEYVNQLLFGHIDVVFMAFTLLALIVPLSFLWIFNKYVFSALAWILIGVNLSASLVKIVYNYTVLHS